MKITYNRIISVMLSALILFSFFGMNDKMVISAKSLPIQLGADEYTSQEKLISYKQVAQNETLTMFADEYGHFCVRVDKTGYIWYSHPNDELLDKTTIGMNKQNLHSEIVVGYVYKDDSGNTASYSEAFISGKTALREGTVIVKKIKNGIKVVYDFFAIATRVTVSFTLQGNSLCAKIIGKETLEREKFKNVVKETASKEQLEQMQDSFITSVWLLPSFGAGNKEENGFVFVPDGSGAYMDYIPINASSDNVNIPIYGIELSIDDGGLKKENFVSVTKEAKAYFPMFAIAREKEGFFATVEQGAEISSFNAFKSGKSNAYTGVSAQIDYRKVTYGSIGSVVAQGVTNIYETLSDFSVKYNFISAEKMSYALLANNYQKWLEEDKIIEKQQFFPSLSLQIVGAVDLPSHFVGIPCKKITALTTFAQSQAIISYLKKKGVEGVSVNYIGWLNNGLQNNKIIKYAKPLKLLGGQNGLKLFVDSLSSKDTIYLDADIQSFKKSGNGIHKNSDSAKTAFDKLAKQRKFSFSTFEYENTPIQLLAPEKIEYIFDRYLKSTLRLPNNVALSFNSAASKCYSDFDSNEGISRIKTVKLYCDAFEKVDRNMSAQKANMYSWKYVNRIFNAPNCSSRQRIYDGEIPFYQMVLHGYVALTSPAINQCGTYRSAFLRAVETGSELDFIIMHEDANIVNGTDYDYLFGSTFNYISQDIVEMYDEYAALLSRIYNEKITDYIIHAPLVVETVYSNGISVYVNYTDCNYVIDELITIPANGFCYKEESGK